MKLSFHIDNVMIKFSTFKNTCAHFLYYLHYYLLLVLQNNMKPKWIKKIHSLRYTP